MGKDVYVFVKESIIDMFEKYEVDFARTLVRAGLKQELIDKKITPAEYVKLRTFATTEYIRKVVEI